MPRGQRFKAKAKKAAKDTDNFASTGAIFSDKKLKKGISVVMAAYKNDKAEWLKQAIDSMLNQTRKPDEVILVVDGPISNDLQSTIKSYGDKIKPIYLPENKGLWNALNVGVEAASYDLIARMDADDISELNRLALQCTEFESDSELSVLGGQIAEFRDGPNEIVSYRKVPLTHEAIVKFAKLRSPFNHPTTVYRKTAFVAVGGCQRLFRSEDYDLWVRMILNGEKCKNLESTLLRYRLNQTNITRKISHEQQIEQIQLVKRFHEYGFLSDLEYHKVKLIRQSFAKLHPTIQRTIYMRGLREKR